MSFNSIRGQDSPIQILKDHIKHDRLAGAYLFTGPEGVGKGFSAAAFAKAVNCLNDNRIHASDCCDSCQSCLKIDNGRHPDVHIIDPEDSEIKIEFIRQLQHSINLKPYEARKKVFIINNAHNLNVASSNAFLKTLEESAGASLIILVTSKPSLLLKTIISRCRIIKFFPLSRTQVEDILNKEYSVDNDLAHFLAYFCEGRLGSALRLKGGGIFLLRNKVLDGFSLAVKGLPCNFPVENRQDMRNCLNILASWLRDMYILKTGIPVFELINADRKTELSGFTQHFSFSELDSILKFLSDSLLNLERNINIKLLHSNLKVELWKG